MLIVVSVCIVVTLASLVFAARCYFELREWARQCNTAQIAIAYKRKVKIVAPLTEWLLWTRQLDSGKENGKTLYQMGGTSVAIIKARKGSRKPTPQTSGAAPKATQGAWAATDDKTGRKQSQMSHVTEGETNVQ